MNAHIRVLGLSLVVGTSALVSVFATTLPAFADDWTDANDAGTKLLKAKKYAEAEKYFKTARDISAGDKEKYGHYATTLLNLGLVYEKLNKIELSEKCYREVLPIYEKAYSKNSLEVSNALQGLADLCRENGRLSEAEPLYKRAIAIREVSAPISSDFGDSLSGLSEVLRRLGRDADAEPSLKRCISVRKQVHGRNHLKVVKPIESLASCNMSLGKYDQAESLFREALSLREALYGTTSPKLAATLESYAECFSKQKKYERAEPLLKRAVTLREPLEKTEKPQLVACLNSYAELLKKMNKTADAAKVQARVKSLTTTGKPEAAPTASASVKKG